MNKIKEIGKVLLDTTTAVSLIGFVIFLILLQAELIYLALKALI